MFLPEHIIVKILYTTVTQKSVPYIGFSTMEED